MRQYTSRVLALTRSKPVLISSRKLSYEREEDFMFSNKDLKTQLFPEIVQPENPYFLKIAILGEPNVGKSSLINSLMPRDMFPTSHVMHTTYKKSTGVMTHGNVQIAFLDTPGIVTVREARNKKVNKTVLSDPIASVQEADLLLVLFDIANKHNVTSLHPVVVKYLRQYDLPAILVLNKMDNIKHQQNVLKQLDSIVRSYSRVSRAQEDKKIEVTPNEETPSRFRDTFFISSVTGQGIVSLKEYLLNSANPGQWQYPGDFTNDMDVLELISEFIRAQLLSHYFQEVPHAVVQLNEGLVRREDGSLSIKQVILCPYVGIIQRMEVSEGKVLQSVEDKAAKQLSIAFQTRVELEIELRVHKFKKLSK